MSNFEHHFETHITRHPVGKYYYTVVYLDPSLHKELPLDKHARRAWRLSKPCCWGRPLCLGSASNATL